MKHRSEIPRRSFLGKIAVILTGVFAAVPFMTRSAAQVPLSSGREPVVPSAQTRVRIHPQAVQRTQTRSMPNV